jgi:hypothetical protein
MKIILLSSRDWRMILSWFINKQGGPIGTKIIWREIGSNGTNRLQ